GQGARDSNAYAAERQGSVGASAARAWAFAPFHHARAASSGAGEYVDSNGEFHIRLRTDDRLQSFANDRMVFDAENSNVTRLGHPRASRANMSRDHLSAIWLRQRGSESDDKINSRGFRKRRIQEFLP